jgi:hypothetical protein
MGPTKMSDQEQAEVIEKGKDKMPKYCATMKADEIVSRVAYIGRLASEEVSRLFVFKDQH